MDIRWQNGAPRLDECEDGFWIMDAPRVVNGGSDFGQPDVVHHALVVRGCFAGFLCHTIDCECSFDVFFCPYTEEVAKSVKVFEKVDGLLCRIPL